MNPVQPAIEHGQRIFHDGVDVRGRRLRRGETGQGGKFVHQRAQCFHRSADGFGATVENVQRSCVRWRAAFQMTADALRRKRDGSQRVFDFMRDPARHFPPGGLFLSLEQVGQVFEDQNIAQARCSAC